MVVRAGEKERVGEAEAAKGEAAKLAQALRTAEATILQVRHKATRGWKRLAEREEIGIIGHPSFRVCTV